MPNSSMSRDRDEKRENSDGEGEPRGAVFNALDSMLKGSLDRLTTMRFVLLIIYFVGLALHCS